MPVQTLLERTRARQAREAFASTRSSSPPLHGSPTFTPNPLPTLDFNATPNLSVVQRKAFGDRVLKKIKLESNPQAEFVQFVEMANQDECDALQVAYTLRLTDMISKSMQETVVNWTPPKSLEKALCPLIYALLLIPNVKFYSGNLTSTLMITESLAPNSDIENIAALTQRLLTSHAKSFNATLTIYFRIALIRYHVEQKHPPNAFCGKVDDDLEELYKDGPQAVVENLKTLYEDDVEAHGDQAESDFTISTEIVGEKRPKWYRHVHHNTPKIQRVGKVRATKRKRDSEEEEEEDELAHQGEEQEPENAPVDHDVQNPSD
ncbi:hypothetical protein C8R43DRAFT_1120808 [Mycena crocata]|nr:hypothetical protein C8R43DRAFT_1120808 [Mycena crocata]